MSRFSRRSLFAVVAFALTSATAVVQAAPASGMLLGVYAFENFRGLRITDTIPGYSAEGRLFADDVLLQATTDGVDVYSIRTMRSFEFAKDRIGPNRPAAIEVFRPGVGRIYFWVEFTPVGGGVRAYGAAPQMKAQFKTETERPGARALFNGVQGGDNGGFNGGDDSSVRPQRPQAGQGNPGSLFGR